MSFRLSENFIAPRIDIDQNFVWQKDFIELCEQSGVVKGQSGWVPLYFDDEDFWSTGYLKFHSYGEYIFDWSWANLYQKMNKNYYPKLIHGIPFTPVNAPKYFGNLDKTQKINQFYQDNDALHSHHWYFIKKEEAEYFNDEQYFIQKTLQYHFQVKDKTFEDFLKRLKARKRKQIRKERDAVKEYPLKIECKKGSELTKKDLANIYELYLTTIDKKFSYAYLNEKFFFDLPQFLNDHFLVFFAIDNNDQAVAMSSFIVSSTTLYGRYWGIKASEAHTYNYLHFEMCYYRGMEYVIENGLHTFEAGAQGEQKLLRGFEPTVIYSAHHLKERELHGYIGEAIGEQNIRIIKESEELRQYLPYKEI